jgi:hypothetical protein
VDVRVENDLKVTKKSTLQLVGLLVVAYKEIGLNKYLPGVLDLLPVDAPVFG